MNHHFTKIAGTERITLADNAPEWLKEAVQAAHQGDFPDDWIYEECAAAAGEDLTEDSLHEYVDGRVEIYTKDLYNWAADHCLSNTYAAAEDRDAECGSSSADGVIKRFQAIQYFAIEHIATTIMQAKNR